MHPIKTYLKQSGRKLLWLRLVRDFKKASSLTLAYLLLYMLAIVAVRPVSLTLRGVFLVPLVVAMVYFFISLRQIWLLRNERQIARTLEYRFPQFQLSLRSALDFLEGKVDEKYPAFQEAYLERVGEKLASFVIRDPPTMPWGRLLGVLLVSTAGFWGLFHQRILDKYYNPALSIGQTHLDLSEGSISIFEPSYTQTPGRTLPLRPGLFHAYPGARVRFTVQLPPEVKTLYLRQDEGEPSPLRMNNEHQAYYEFVLLENRMLAFLLEEKRDGGRTQPYRFELKTDTLPELELRKHTPEGPISPLDPLIVEAEIKDDFGVKSLEAVVSWEDGERRLPITVPLDRKKHFLSRNQWYLSDLGVEDATSFTIRLEAKDNNPITGPGLGTSPTLSFELESPEKKYDEFMELARELLNSMSHALGDNLDTIFASTMHDADLSAAEAMGRQINGGLFHSQQLTNQLIKKVRETPNITQLDRNFLFEFRNELMDKTRKRTEIGLLFGNLYFRKTTKLYSQLQKRHGVEEADLETLTYDLLLRLKMWAVLELERKNEELGDSLDQLQDLLDHSENMESEDLEKMFNKLMDEVMKDFNEMMMKAAQEMDMSIQEFMNMDAMKGRQEEMQDLREQILEALREGDLEKAKKLMETMRSQMEGAFGSMQQSMGELSPEMQAMMENMRELMGLLRELKAGEEDLQSQTQELKRKIDEEMGGNTPELDEEERETLVEIAERIRLMLEDLYNQLVNYKPENLVRELVESINYHKKMLENPELESDQRRHHQVELAKKDQLIRLLGRDGLTRLQDAVLRNLNQSERLRAYLEENELMLSLEAGLKLESSLVQAERFSERNSTDRIRREAHPRETLEDAKTELYKILDALQNLKRRLEQRRQQFMRQTGQSSQEALARRQQELSQMIQQFLEDTEETFGDTQIERTLEEIGDTMDSAEQRLSQKELDGSIRHEQSALQRIGELLDQLQQSQSPSGRPNSPRMVMPLHRNEGNFGDPSLEDIYIPEGEQRMGGDSMKDAIRRQLEGNMPENYGKEIRKYYEKLMDQ